MPPRRGLRYRMRRITLASCALAIAAMSPPMASALGLEDLETFEQLESMDLFAAAVSAAEADDIPRARALLEQALGTSGAAQGRAEAERAIAAAETRERERIRLEEERRLAAEEEERRLAAEAEERRLAEEAARAAAAAVPTTGSATAGGRHRCITVQADCTSGFGCVVDELTVTGGPGVIENSGGRSSSMVCTNYARQLAGVYGFGMRIGDRFCSGRFSIPSNVRYGVNINVYSDSCDISYVSDY